ncbi:hypothetical protein [Psychroflexus sp. MBR-150]
MKLIRSIARSKYFASIMSCLLIFLTVDGVRSNNIITESINNSNLKLNFLESNTSGEQMFREIFFLQDGKFVEALPVVIQKEYEQIKNLNSIQLEERKKMINQVISLIKKHNSEYFHNLKEAVVSDNPYEIKDKIKRGGELVINALKLNDDYQSLVNYLENRELDLSDSNQVEKLAEELRLQTSKAALSDKEICIAVATVGVLAIAVAGVAVIATVFVEVINYGIDSKPQSSTLKAEKYINAIIANY